MDITIKKYSNKIQQEEYSDYLIKCSIEWMINTYKGKNKTDIIIDINFTNIKFNNESIMYTQINLQSDFDNIPSIIIDNKEINNIYKNNNGDYLILYDDRIVQYIEKCDNYDNYDKSNKFKQIFGKLFF